MISMHPIGEYYEETTTRHRYKAMVWQQQTDECDWVQTPVPLSRQQTKANVLGNLYSFFFFVIQRGKVAHTNVRMTLQSVVILPPINLNNICKQSTYCTLFSIWLSIGLIESCAAFITWRWSLIEASSITQTSRRFPKSVDSWICSR